MWMRIYVLFLSIISVLCQQSSSPTGHPTSSPTLNTNCASGFYYSEEESQCVECNPGTFRMIGMDNKGCDLCAVGTYSPTYQMASCLPCPIGKNK